MTTFTERPQSSASIAEIILAFVAVAVGALVPGGSLLVALALAATRLRGNRTARILLVLFGLLLFGLQIGLLKGSTNSWVGPPVVAG